VKRLRAIAGSMQRVPEEAKVAIFVIAMVAYATAGFMLFERPGKPELQWVDALWWAIVTMTTVGYGDYFPQTLAGRFLVAYPAMLVGLGMLGYGLSRVALAFVRAESLGRKGLVGRKVQGHILVCNYPGRERLEQLIDELRSQPHQEEASIVLVDEHLEELSRELAHRGVQYVRGNPARAETLHRAAVEQADRAVVLARNANEPASDDTTVAVCLSLRDLCPELHIVAESVLPHSDEILRRAGCNSVVCVSTLTPGLLAQELHDPGIVEVLRELSTWNSQVANIFVVPLSLASSDGKTVEHLHTWAQAAQLTLLGIRNGGHVVLNPDRARSLNGADAAIVVGRNRPAAIEL